MFRLLNDFFHYVLECGNVFIRRKKKRKEWKITLPSEFVGAFAGEQNGLLG